MRAPCPGFWKEVVFRGLVLALIVGTCFFYTSSSAQEDERQYKVEAAFLYNFFNYITWPGYSSPQALEQPVICVYENDPVRPYLGYMQRKMAGERALTIQAVKEEDATAGCHILFMRHRVSSHLLRSSLANDTLTVSRPEDPLDRGGMIELIEDDERLRVSINQPLLEQNGFTVSSRLMELAQRGSP